MLNKIKKYLLATFYLTLIIMSVFALIAFSAGLLMSYYWIFYSIFTLTVGIELLVIIILAWILTFLIVVIIRIIGFLGDSLVNFTWSN